MNKKKRNALIIIVNFVLLVIGVYLLSFNYFIDKKNHAFETINLQINGNRVPENIEKTEQQNTTADESLNDEQIGNYRKNNGYIGILEIPKISLTRGLVSMNSSKNNVDYNIQIIKPSDYPDVQNGNLILAAHSGSSSISFFKNLWKLSNDDEIYVHYNNKKYIYKIVKISYEPKTGEIAIYRDYSKTCLTLVTCTKNDETKQTVYVAELINVEDEG